MKDLSKIPEEMKFSSKSKEDILDELILNSKGNILKVIIIMKESYNLGLLEARNLVEPRYYELLKTGEIGFLKD